MMFISRFMFYFYTTLQLMLLIVATSCFAQANTGQPLLILGDSISAAYGIRREKGWVALLEQKLTQEQESYEVINASISGETTGGALARLPGLLKQYKPAIVVIELGGNDGLRGFPIKVLRQNLTALSQQAKEAGAQVLLLGMQLPPNYGKRYTQLFKESFVIVAEQQQVVLMPFLLEGIATKGTYMQSDGIHPTESAQPLMLALVMPYLEKLLAVTLSTQ